MLDVVIVAKNEQKHLGAVLASLAAQNTTGIIRTFVVDNGSTDETIAIATTHGARVITNHGTLGAARNAGIASGDSKLVAFLDAHSVPVLTWAKDLTAVFADKPDLGAAMGSIENISERPGTQLFAKNSIFESPYKLWRNTVSGINSPLPWIPTGNCVYSRAALDAVGGFDEQLLRCEDTDLSWKVVLKGYQLAYVPEAKVTHYDSAGATSYLRKYYSYGAGAAELAKKYGLHAEPKTEKLKGTKFLLNCCYQLGFRTKFKQKNTAQKKHGVDKKFRQTFQWSDEFNLSVSPNTIFWDGGENRLICVNLNTETRTILDDSGAHIFRMLAKHSNRARVIEKISGDYSVDKRVIAQDVDEVVGLLIDDGVLVRYELSPNQAASHSSK